MVCDNLDTHDITSLYLAFDAPTEHRLARRLRIVHTPRNGSWLNIAEMELSVLTRQCLNRRFESVAAMRDAISDWQAARHSAGSGASPPATPASNSKLSPRNRKYENRWSTTWLDDQLNVAQQLLKESVQMQETASNWYLLGEVNRHANRAESAMAAYQQCLRIHPFHGRALDRLAELGSQGNPAAAP